MRGQSADTFLFQGVAQSLVWSTWLTRGSWKVHIPVSPCTPLPTCLSPSFPALTPAGLAMNKWNWRPKAYYHTSKILEFLPVSVPVSCPEWELKEEEDGKAKRTQQRHEGTHGNSKGFTHIIGGQDHVPHFSLTKTLRDEAGRHHGPRVESAKQRGCWEEWPNDLVWSSHPSPLSQSPAGECLQLKGQGTTICSSPLWLTASLSPPAFLSSLLLSLLVCFARNQIQQQLSQNQWVTH